MLVMVVFSLLAVYAVNLLIYLVIRDQGKALGWTWIAGLIVLSGGPWGETAWAPASAGMGAAYAAGSLILLLIAGVASSRVVALIFRRSDEWKRMFHPTVVANGSVWGVVIISGYSLMRFWFVFFGNEGMNLYANLGLSIILTYVAALLLLGVCPYLVYAIFCAVMGKGRVRLDSDRTIVVDR